MARSIQSLDRACDRRWIRSAGYVLALVVAFASGCGSRDVQPEPPPTRPPLLPPPPQRDSRWLAPAIVSSTNVEDSSGMPCFPAPAIDGAGRALVAWFQNEPATGPFGPTQAVMVSRFDPAQGWSTPEALASGIFFNGGEPPRVAMDESGHGLVAWLETDLPESRARARSFDPVLGWSDVVELERALSEPRQLLSAVELAASPDGNFVATWKLDRPNVGVRGVRWTPKSGFSEVSTFRPNLPTFSYSVGLDAARGGAAILAVMEPVPEIDGSQLITRRAALDSTFGADEPLTEVDWNWDGSFRLALDASGGGHALVTEGNHTGGGWSVTLFHESVAGGWEMHHVETGACCGTPRADLVIDDDGSALTLFTDSYAQIHAVRVGATNSAIESTIVDSSYGDDTVSFETTLAGMSDGRAVALWARNQTNGTTAEVVSRFYEPGEGWSPTEKIPDHRRTPAIGYLQLVANDTGDALAVWCEDIEPSPASGNYDVRVFGAFRPADDGG